MTTDGYLLRKLSESGSLPLTIEQAKRNSQIDADIVEFDTWFEEAIEEAVDYVERYCQTTLRETAYELTLQDFPFYCGELSGVWIDLPRGPVLEVSAVVYLDQNGAEQALDAARWTAEIGESTARLAPTRAANYSWPALIPGPGAVRVTYTAGYRGAGSPPDGSGVPPSIRRALKLLVSHWFENREAVLVGTVSAELEVGLHALLQPYRHYP